ncbi:MAG: tetratricopeptide repeat protein [Polyangia bacterium]
MRSALALGLVVAVTAAAPPARAADDATAVAREAYDKGMAHYHLEEYDPAIEEWERGFRAKPAPEFLYNIAQAYRLSKRPEKALSFYQKYLRVSPEAKNRDEVERHIASLKEIVDKQKTSAESPPQTTLPTPGTATTTPPPSTSTPSTSTTSTRADLVAQPETRPVYKKAWFWGVMGGVAAVVVAGVVVGVVVGTRSNVQSLQDARF